VGLLLPVEIIAQSGNPTVTAANASRAFTASNIYALPSNVGSITLTGTVPNSSAAFAAIKSKCKWKIVRNSADVDQSDPTAKLITNSSNPEIATLDTTDLTGSFNVCYYYDADGSGWAASKVVAVFNIVLVKVTVQLSSITPDSTQFTHTSSGGLDTFFSGSLLNPPISMLATVLVQGGGADGMLGIS
jgi:hypothetical protein